MSHTCRANPELVLSSHQRGQAVADAADQFRLPADTCLQEDALEMRPRRVRRDVQLARCLFDGQSGDEMTDQENLAGRESERVAKEGGVGGAAP
jgi:hypothetical protein